MKRQEFYGIGFLLNHFKKKKNCHSRFTSPSPHPALQKPLVFIKALNGACQRGSPPSSTLTSLAPQLGNQDDIASLALRACELLQRYPTAPGTRFVEDSFSMDCRWGRGWFGDDSSALHLLCTLFPLLLHQLHLRSPGIQAQRL